MPEPQVYVTSRVNFDDIKMLEKTKSGDNDEMRWWFHVGLWVQNKKITCTEK